MWTVNIKIESSSFGELKSLAEDLLQHTVRARTIWDLGCGGVGGVDGDGYRYQMTVSSPVEARIASLREEADRLEASLKPVA